MTKEQIIDFIQKRTIDEWKMLQDMRNSGIFNKNEISRQRSIWATLDEILENIIGDEINEKL